MPPLEPSVASLALSEAERPPKFSGNDPFRKIFLSSNDALLLLSATANEVLDVNPRASVVFGYTRQQFSQLPPRATICVQRGQWELLLESASGKAEKWLRGMGCRQKSGHIIFRDIRPSVVDIGGAPYILVTIHDAVRQQLSRLLRADAQFMRFSNAVVAGAAAMPSLEDAIRFCIRQLCDHARWVFAHAHIFSERILAARVPVDLWHFGLHERAESFKAMLGAKCLVFPENWYSGILARSQAVILNDLEDRPEILKELGVQNSGLKSMLAAPILVRGEVAGLCQYFSDEPIGHDQLFLDIMGNLTGRLGQIIDQKLADENAHSLLTRLFHVEDDQRRQLARELHDTTAQKIAALLMDLGVVSGNSDALRPEARNALSESVSLARESLQEIRSFSYLIYPPMLDELGLISALRMFIQGFSQRSGMHVQLDAPESSPRLPTQLETTLFRVVQEGLTNARRHSGSTTAEVRLRVNPTEVRLCVDNETTDDLRWEKASLQPAKFGVGMRSMQERVQHLGGHLSFHIGKNRTVLETVFPLAQAAAATSA